MKFALVNGQRQIAQPGLRGTCPECEQPVIARCGKIRFEHWAHKVRSNCNNRWETEGPWHRNWKGQFPDDWQEVVHQAETGEKHIADVKTDRGWVIEFQHSYLKPEERRSRDTFYPKLIWVVDGTRRKRDRNQFLKAWEEGTPVGAKSPVRRAFSDDCRLLQEWSGSPGPVFYDFGEDMLGWLLAKRPQGPVYVARFPRAEFIQIHRQTGTQIAHDFNSFVEELSQLVDNYESHLRARASNRLPPHLARRRPIRRRFRL